ncbi:hypothetical protein SGLAM104S_09577 [Streptomyces glaucescens]
MPSGPRSVKSPRNHSRAVPAHPVPGGVDQAPLLKGGDQLVEIAVHVPDDEQRAGTGGGGGDGCRVDGHLKRVTRLMRATA